MKQEILLERGIPVEHKRLRESRRTALPRGSQSWVYGDGISFWVVSAQSFWLSPSWYCRHCSAKMDSSKEDSGRLVGHVASPDLSQILPVDGGLLVPCSLLRPPVIKYLIQMVTVVHSQGAQFQSEFSHNITTDATERSECLWRKRLRFFIFSISKSFSLFLFFLS